MTNYELEFFCGWFFFALLSSERVFALLFYALRKIHFSTVSHKISVSFLSKFFILSAPQ
jgi:hypothetical protein